MRRRGWVLVALTLGLAGCAQSALPAETLRPTASAVAVDELRVGLLEWSVAVDVQSVVAGDVHVVVTNTGASRHRLLIEGEEGRWTTPLLDPGATSELAIRTRAGETLRLGCIVEGHGAHAPAELVVVSG